jgi:hypothetical protein
MTRKTKVEEESVKLPIPIRLKGEWLERADFKPDTHAEVQVEFGRVIISTPPAAPAAASDQVKHTVGLAREVKEVIIKVQRAWGIQPGVCSPNDGGKTLENHFCITLPLGTGSVGFYPRRLSGTGQLRRLVQF